MDNVVERLMRYAMIDTQSDEHANLSVTPSTTKQFDLANLLVSELKGLGLSGAFCDDKCYVYGWLDATPECEDLPAIGVIAHVDTSPDAPAHDVKPQVLHYDGGDLVLNKELGISMNAKQFPTLAKYKGQDLVCTDGTTLLGADDKAGVAVIMQAVEEIIKEGKPHTRICVAFTPDEEIGMGASGFDVEGFGADFAYTLDGDDITNYNCESFNAAKTTVTINGLSVHPGTAKGQMLNALLIAIEYNALLPPMEIPSRTEGYEGFIHLHNMHGGCDKAVLEYIVRDHDMERFKERKHMMGKAAEEINRRYPDGTCVVETKDQYYNMYEILKDHQEVLTLAEEAMKAAGVASPTHLPIRGGTDGAMLTFKGLICPNLPGGYHNAHGRFEYAPVESLKKAVKIVKNLVGPDLLKGFATGKHS